MKLFGLLVWVVLIALVGCQPAAPDGLAEADKTAIAAALQAYVDASLANDSAARAAMYTEDAVLMPATGPAIYGRDNIKAVYDASPAISAFEVKIEEIEGVADLAYVRGTLKVTLAPEGAEPISFAGGFLEIRQRQADGSWPYIRDIYTMYPIVTE